MKHLKVILHDRVVGFLEQNKNGRLSFRYTSDWLECADRRPLSQSLPLRAAAFGERECAAFFGGLLPEADNRERIASNLGITARNDYAMLREIGGECAGALSLIATDKSPEPESDRYAPVTEDELILLLDQLPQRPLLAGKGEIRLSLAGAQNKLALRYDATGYAIPLNESPSTHILKPEWTRFPGLVDNETYCLKLAADLGLNVCEVESRQFGSHRCLQVKRFDRLNQSGKVCRLHQEDFCQALGIPSRIKYQNEGGPDLAQCFDLVRRASSSPAKDLLQLFHAVLFNFLVGNHDAHGKNFSLLYSEPKEPLSIRLAPLYDLVSTAAYPDLTDKMAMKVGKTYKPMDLRLRDWELYWARIGFSGKQARRQTLQFTEKLATLATEPENEMQDVIQKTIRSRIQALHRLNA